MAGCPCCDQLDLPSSWRQRILIYRNKGLLRPGRYAVHCIRPRDEQGKARKDPNRWPISACSGEAGLKPSLHHGPFMPDTHHNSPTVDGILARARCRAGMHRRGTAGGVVAMCRLRANPNTSRSTLSLTSRIIKAKGPMNQHPSGRPREPRRADLGGGQSRRACLGVASGTSRIRSGQLHDRRIPVIPCPWLLGDGNTPTRRRPMPCCSAKEKTFSAGTPFPT